jgi:hypothetical protein
MLLCYSTHEVFKSHVKSSQADFLYSSSTANFPWLSPVENRLDPEPMNSVTYIAEERTRIIGDMSRDHHLPLRDVTADTKNTISSIVACWNVFTELLPDKALIKSLTKFTHSYTHTFIQYTCCFSLKCVAFYATRPFFSDNSMISAFETSYSR